MCHSLFFSTAQKWQREKDFEIPNYGDFQTVEYLLYRVCYG